VDHKVRPVAANNIQSCRHSHWALLGRNRTDPRHQAVHLVYRGRAIRIELNAKVDVRVAPAYPVVQNIDCDTLRQGHVH
jgi:hypothetical protein